MFIAPFITPFISLQFFHLLLYSSVSFTPLIYVTRFHFALCFTFFLVFFFFFLSSSLFTLFIIFYSFRIFILCSSGLPLVVALLLFSLIEDSAVCFLFFFQLFWVFPSSCLNHFSFPTQEEEAFSLQHAWLELNPCNCRISEWKRKIVYFSLSIGRNFCCML
jgi:hypothetical protein